ncbi:hypothetical protein SDRG_08735 [Saprolegnia diclina VS20]|uniref:PRA1 family protein n=1 Tax=Saprolegnia diclina (strain VS20) TaxID=1156394 RepID=T0QFW9_SAPDV|nr:hypothetical protein SDRG_08735 [Saprolegnia diclina VS20]EQC33631.1 hypothetical protein SDRG_08735 [Saprolegnia diclina VS20]|eukprot:XP_008612854.1 hypothetical protein SDRG_08735 [Saprolegnia diclina VS20]
MLARSTSVDTQRPIEINPLSLISYDNIRDLQTFAGLGDLLSRPYTLPNSSGELSRRFQRNVLFFIANYAVVFGFFTFLNALAAPQFLFVLMLLGAGWFYFDKLATEESLRSGPTYFLGVPTTTEQRNTILVITSLVLSVIYGGPVLMYALSSSVFLCAAHACLRNAQLPTDEEMVHLLHVQPAAPEEVQYKQQTYIVV